MIEAKGAVISSYFMHVISANDVTFFLVEENCSATATATTATAEWQSTPAALCLKPAIPKFEPTSAPTREIHTW